MKRILPLLLISSGVLLLILVAGLLVFNLIKANPAPEALPEQIAGLSLARHSFGRAAVDEIYQLHGKIFSLTSGAVGVYGSGSQATLWVSGTANRFMAQRLTAEMRRRIAVGKSPFIEIGIRNLDGREIYELSGLGQQHFYFGSADRVIWLAVDQAQAEQALQQVLEFYP